MRAFLTGTLIAVVLAVVTGFVINAFEVPNESFNSSEYVRLKPEKTNLD